MNICHTNLEIIRKNPEHYKTIPVSAGKKTVSMLKYWQMAAVKYHESSENNSITLQYLEAVLKKNFKSNTEHTRKFLQLTYHLATYFKEYQKYSFSFEGACGVMNFKLYKDNIISGEIFRIDKKNNNYFITLFYDGENRWRDELRFPLFQIYYSNLLNCPAGQIFVGVFNYNKLQHEYISFDESTLNDSLEEVKEIFERIAENKKIKI